MRLGDANILVYAFTTSFRQHDRARAWLAERLSDPVPTGVRAEHVPDAHLAALALEHGLAVASADGDFTRFPNVRLENPLA
jgi:predicted nucleic acid-binding protein